MNLYKKDLKTSVKTRLLRAAVGAVIGIGMLLPAAASAQDACCAPMLAAADATPTTFNTTVEVMQMPRPAISGAVTSIDWVRAGESLHMLVGVQAEADKPNPPTTQPGTKSVKPSLLFYTRLNPPFEKWTAPVRVNSPDQNVTKLSRGSDARLAVNGDSMVAMWTLPGNGAMGTGALAVSRSEDGGKTWFAADNFGPKTNPSETVETRHGFRFPALTVQHNIFHLVWIDAYDDLRRLGHASSADAGKSWSAPRILDSEICACCPNSLTASATRIYGLFRNLHPSDMGMAISADRGATFDVTPSIDRFDWEFEGCPHVGGAIALIAGDDKKPDALVCTTWSGSARQCGVHVTRSINGGKSWSVPALISETTASRTSDITALDGQRLAATWDELDGSRKAIFAATSNDGGATWSKPIRLSGAGGDESADHPRVAAVNGRFIFTWTQTTTKPGAFKLEWRDLAAP